MSSPRRLGILRFTLVDVVGLTLSAIAIACFVAAIFVPETKAPVGCWWSPAKSSCGYAWLDVCASTTHSDRSAEVAASGYGSPVRRPVGCAFGTHQLVSGLRVRM
jgi:hypothetical protein